MKIKIEMDINTCQECPYAQKIVEHGFSATVCSKSKDLYDIIPNQGIKHDCPLKIKER